MNSWFRKTFSRLCESDNDTEQGEKDRYKNLHRYPLNRLAEQVGKRLEVHYIDLGKPQVLEATLKSKPSGDFFYLPFGGSEMNIVYWHNSHADGRLSGVKLIRHGDNVLYKDDTLTFDYEKAERYTEEQMVTGPNRVMTREYLGGVFG